MYKDNPMPSVLSKVEQSDPKHNIKYNQKSKHEK